MWVTVLEVTFVKVSDTVATSDIPTSPKVIAPLPSVFKTWLDEPSVVGNLYAPLNVIAPSESILNFSPENGLSLWRITKFPLLSFFNWVSGFPGV